MKDLRNNKTEFYVIIADSCWDGDENIETFIFDNEEAAREKFERLIADDKAFLEEEGRDDIIERSENSYQSYPEGEYSKNHCTLDLLITKHNA